MSQEDWGEMERAAGAGRAAYAEGRTGLDLWLSLKGRITRSDYWLKFALPIFVVQAMGIMVDTMAIGVTPYRVGPARVLTSLLTFWPGIVAAVKRLHDLGHPGWYILVFYGGTFGAGIAMAVAIPLWGSAGLVVGIPFVFLMLGAIWYSVKMMVVRGTRGPNAYGPDPLG